MAKTNRKREIEFTVLALSIIRRYIRRPHGLNSRKTINLIYEYLSDMQYTGQSKTYDGACGKEKELLGVIKSLLN